ncbi:MAG: sulfotransferase [Candidatus Frackibacter sp. T328-2]|nr:MAG: sulfotransferase [Candidatus Frackibacter sp. T328-2]
MQVKGRIFIGGTGRSGTTILSKILGKHNNIYRFPCETRFIIDPDGIIDLVPALSDKWSPYIGSKAVCRFKKMMYNLGETEIMAVKLRRKVMSEVLNRSPKKYLHFPLGDIIGKKQYFKELNNFLDKLIDVEFKGLWVGTDSYLKNPKIFSTKKFAREEIINLSAEFINNLFTIPLKKQNKSFWVDHTPFNILHATFLNELFPDMKIIHIYRDIRDVISSYKTKNWGGNDAQDIILWQKQILQRWLEVKTNLSENSYYEIKLEELIDNPKKNLKDIFRFIGIPFDEKVLQIGLNKGHIGRWKKDLIKEEIDLVKKELFDIMKKYDYNW